MEYKNIVCNICSNIGMDNITIMLIWIMEILGTIIEINIKNKIIKKMIIISMWLTINVLEYSLFYIYYESILIPISILVLKGLGSIIRRKGITRLIYNTCISSIGILISILMIIYRKGNTVIEWLDITIIDNILSLISFSIKIPINPLHKWLIYAHSESSTIGSVILGGLILKLGIYGIYRINIRNKEKWLIILMLIITMISSINSSMIIILELDIKRIIAYSSIILMNIILGNLIMINWIGIYNSIILTYTLSLICSGLFILIGILYNRYLTKDNEYYSGLNINMNIFSKILLIMFFSNISLPLTCSFIGEFFIIWNFYLHYGLITIFILLSILFINILFIWYNTKILYTLINIYLLLIFDICRLEFFIIILFIFYITIIGIFPTYFTFLCDCITFYLLLI